MELVVLCIICLLLLYFFTRNECLTGLEVYQKTHGKLEMSYDDMKNKMPEVNIVNYYDFKKLAKEGKYTAANIDKVLQI